MVNRKKLSNEEVLATINGFIIEHGFPPTIEELRKILGVGSSRTVLRYLKLLEADGLIERWPGARGIRLKKSLDSSSKTVRVPLVGDVTAGALMIAEENLEGWVHLPPEFLPRRDAKHFLLRITGDSMNQASINDELIEEGDLVLVEQKPTAVSGQIVVALLDGEATVKRLVQGPDYWVLKPESSEKYDSIFLNNNFQVQGVVTKVLKQGGFLLDDY